MSTKLSIIFVASFYEKIMNYTAFYPFADHFWYCISRQASWGALMATVAVTIVAIKFFGDKIRIYSTERRPVAILLVFFATIITIVLTY